MKNSVIEVYKSIEMTLIDKAKLRRRTRRRRKIVRVKSDYIEKCAVQ